MHFVKNTKNCNVAVLPWFFPIRHSALQNKEFTVSCGSNITLTGLYDRPISVSGKKDLLPNSMRCY